MKLDNRGFAISTFMYMLLILAMILILATLAIFSSRKMILDKQKNVAMENSLSTSKKICKAVNGVKSLETGTKYECKVNSTDTFNFYVLSTEETKINLIMDRNICEDGTAEDVANNNICRYTWNDYGINGKGPTTAMEKLYNATKEWANILDIKLDYIDEQNGNSFGYGKIFTSDKGIYITEKNSEVNLSNSPTIAYTNQKLKARLLKYGEIMDIENNTYCFSDDYYNCPRWLFNNMEESGTYWTLSSYELSANNVMILSGAGVVNSVPANEIAGIRPVITVSKSNLYS